MDFSSFVCASCQFGRRAVPHSRICAFAAPGSGSGFPRPAANPACAVLSPLYPAPPSVGNIVHSCCPASHLYNSLQSRSPLSRAMISASAVAILVAIGILYSSHRRTISFTSGSWDLGLKGSLKKSSDPYHSARSGPPASAFPQMPRQIFVDVQIRHILHKHPCCLSSI